MSLFVIVMTVFALCVICGSVLWIVFNAVVTKVF